MKQFSFTTPLTDAIENFSGFSLDDDCNIPEIQYIDCFKQTPKEIQNDKIHQ